jgi:DegV family protein with EDD domain
VKIKIITDSAADLPVDIMTKHQISVVPHVVIFEDKPWKLGVDISIEDFYSLLKDSDFFPSSANPEASDFLNLIEESLDKKDYDHVFCISVAKELSGSTFSAYRLAIRNYSDRVTLVNTESASGVQGLIALYVSELAQQGKNIEQITKAIENLIPKYYLNVGFHTLDNVYKSGRIKSKFVLYLTKIIGVKPIAQMERPGILVSSIPVFFSKKGMVKKLLKLAIKGTDEKTKYNIVISHVDNLEGAKYLCENLKKARNIDRTFITYASPIVGSNTGMGTIIVSLLPSFD